MVIAEHIRSLPVMRVRAPEFESGFKRWQRSVITATLRSQQSLAKPLQYKQLLLSQHHNISHELQLSSHSINSFKTNASLR
jgi:hypothetical protein